MHSRDDGHTDPGWIRNAMAGCTGALTVLPLILTLGLLAYSPLGAAASQEALLAAYLTASIGSLVHAVLSRTSLPVSAP